MAVNLRWGLGFTLSSLALLTPAGARADEAAEGPTPGTPREEDRTPGDHRTEHLYAAVDAGYSAQSLYGMAIAGTGFTAILGDSLGRFTVGAAFEFVRAWTTEGLQTTTVDIGPVLERRFDRLSIGGGLRVGTFDVSRITSPSPLFSTSAGVFLRLSYDIATFGRGDRSAIYVLGKASVDTVDAPLFAGGVSLGIRFSQ